MTARSSGRTWRTCAKAPSPRYSGERELRSAHYLQPRVLENQRLLPPPAEVHHRPRVLAHVADFLDLPQAELRVLHHGPAAELSRQALCFGLEPLAVFLALAGVGQAGAVSDF